jgi:hypothetical protein
MRLSYMLHLFHTEKEFNELLLAEFCYCFHQQYPEAPKATVPQSFPFSTTRLGGDWFSHYATTSTKYHNRPDVHTCSPLSFQIFSNILTRKNSTIPHINTRYTVTRLLLYFLKDYYNTTPSFMNFKEIWYFCGSQTCNSQSTSLQTTEINYIVASHWLKPTVA